MADNMQKLADTFPTSVIEIDDRAGGETAVKIDHYHMLKIFRREYGTDYAREYVTWFVPHHEQMLEKHPCLISHH